MKLALILVTLIFISGNLFAKKSNFTLKEKYKNKIGNTLSVTKIFKAQDLNTHICKEVIKKNKDGKKKKRVVKKKKYKNGKLVKKVKRVIYFDENGKKSFKGPISLLEIENHDPNTLTIEIDSKNIKNTEIEKFVPFKAKYKVFEPEVNFKDRSGKELASLYEVNGKKRFDINLSELNEGAHDLFVKIHSHKIVHLDKKRKKPIKFVHTANIGFEKMKSDSAHINVRLSDQSETNSRLGFDLSESYSDGGEITHFDILTYKDGELIQNERTNGDDPYVYYFVSSVGDYEFEFIAYDTFGDTDNFRSEVYTVSQGSPQLKYNITRDSENESLFTIDFSGSSAPEGESVSSYRVWIERDGESLEDYNLSSNNSSFNIAFKTRGEFDLYVNVSSTNGQWQWEYAGKYEIQETIPVKSSLIFEYKKLEDSNKPFEYTYYFLRNIDLENIDYFKYKFTNSVGEVFSGNASPIIDPDRDYQMGAAIEFPKNEIYTGQLTLVQKDGTLSLPFEFEQIINVDFGEIILSSNVVLSPDGRSYRFDIDRDNSSPGNYGSFDKYVCEAKNSETGETLYEETPYSLNQYDINRGIWNFECYGVTTLGLESTRNLYTLESINKTPFVGLEITSRNVPGEKSIIINTMESDEDGYVQASELTIQAPSGNIETYSFTGAFYVTLKEVGVHYFSYKVQDDEELWSEPVYQTYEVINSKPIADLNIARIENTRDYEFTYNSSDSDGEISTHNLKLIDPLGAEEVISGSDTFTKTLAKLGTWKIEYFVTDNNGALSDVYRENLEIINLKPLASINVNPIGAPGVKDVRFTYSANDPDGNIVSALTIVTTPSGSKHEYPWGENEDIDFTFWEEGLHTITYTVLDNDGDTSDISLISYEVINQYSPPIAEIIIDPATGSDRSISVTLKYSDAGGEVVKGSLTRTTPNGYFEHFETLEETFQINIDEIGTHTFGYAVVDNDGHWSEEVFASYTFESDVPYPSYELTETGVSGEYQFNPTYTDPNNLISYPELALFGPDGSWQGFDGSSSRTLNLNQIGEWRIILSFFTHDGMRSDSNIKYINVDDLNYEPVAIIKIDKEKPTVNQFEVVEFNAEESYIIDGSPLSFKWIFPDGTEKNDITVFHHFSEIGNQNVRLLVSDTQGNSTEANIDIEVLELIYAKPVPEIEISGNFNNENELLGSLNVDGSFSTSIEGEITEYFWELSDGQTSNSINQNFEFSTPGTYSVKLTVTTEFGAFETKEISVNVLNPVDPRGITSNYSLTINGIDEEKRNSTQSDIQLIVADASFIQDDASILLNETSQDFTRLSNNSFAVNLNLKDGKNILSIVMYDENNNIIEKSITLKAGSITKTVTIKDNNDQEVPNIRVTITYKDDELEPTILNGDEFGVVRFDNIPDLDKVISIVAGDAIFNETYLAGVEISSIIKLEKTVIPSDIENNDLSQGTAGWDILASKSEIQRTGENKLVVEVESSNGAKIERSFLASKDGFISFSTEFLAAPIGKRIKVSLVNHTTGEIYSKIVSSNLDEKVVNPIVKAEQGDIIHLEIEALSDQLNVYQKLINKAVNAYASDLYYIIVSTIENEDYRLDIKLLDLDNSHKKNEDKKNLLNLTPLQFLSIGNYPNGKNPIYGDIQFEAFNNASLEISKIKVLQESTILEVNVDTNNSFIQSLAGLDGVNEKGLNSFYGQEADVTIGSIDPSDYVSFFDIQNNSNFNASKGIQIVVDYKVTINGSPTTGSKVFPEEKMKYKVLIDSGIKELSQNFRYPLDFDLDSPNHGDQWVTEKTKEIQNLLILKNKLGFRIGDSSNINGSYANESFFGVHKWHNDGIRFDAVSVNVEEDEKDQELGFEKFWDLRKILTSKELAPYIEKVIFNVKKGSPANLQVNLNKKSNLCLKGKNIKNLYRTYHNNTSSGLKGFGDPTHDNHWHFKLNESGTGTLGYPENEIPSRITESFFDREDNTRERKFSVSGNFDDLSIIIFRESSNGKVSEKYNSNDIDIVDTQVETVIPGFKGKSGNLDEFITVVKKSNSQISIIYPNTIDVEDLKKYSVYVSQNDTSIVSNPTKPEDYNKYTCYDQELSLNPEGVKDCNKDGVEDDPALYTEAGGIISEKYFSAFEHKENIKDGARVCGELEAATPYFEISGSNIVLEGKNTFGASCDWIALKGEPGLEILNTPPSIIRDNVFCNVEIAGALNSIYYFSGTDELPLSGKVNKNLVGNIINGEVVLVEVEAYNTEFKAKHSNTYLSTIGDENGDSIETKLEGGVAEIYGSEFIRSTMKAVNNRYQLPVEEGIEMVYRPVGSQVGMFARVVNSNLSGFFKMYGGSKTRFPEVFNSTIVSNFFYYNGRYTTHTLLTGGFMSDTFVDGTIILGGRVTNGTYYTRHPRENRQGHINLYDDQNGYEVGSPVRRCDLPKNTDEYVGKTYFCEDVVYTLPEGVREYRDGDLVPGNQPN